MWTRDWGVVAAVALGLGFGPGLLPAMAQSEIRERHAVAADGTVTIRAVTHAVRVQVWDRNEVEVTGSYDPDREAVRVRPGTGSFLLEIELRETRGNWRRQGSGVLQVSIPSGAELRLATVSGDLQVDGVRGRVDARTVSGDVRAQVESPRVDLESVSGDVTLRGRATEGRLITVSGDVDAQASGEVFEGKAVSGDVRIRSSQAVSRATLESVSGNLDFSGAMTPEGRLQANTHSGRIVLTLPRTTRSSVDLSTFSGRLQVEFPDRTDEVRSGGRGPGERWSFTLGGGGGRVEARSFSGGIRVVPGGG